MKGLFETLLADVRRITGSFIGWFSNIFSTIGNKTKEKWHKIDFKPLNYKLIMKKKIEVIILSSSLAVSFLLIFVICKAAYVPAKTVQLNDNGLKIRLVSKDKKVSDVLKRFNVTYNKHDLITPSADSPVKDGIQVNVKRSVWVYVKCDGTEQKVFLFNGKVSDALKKAGISLASTDIVDPAVNSDVIPSEYITVTRMSKRLVIDKKSIPFQVVVKNDDNLKTGNEKVLQEGSEGVHTTKIEVIYKDGVETERKTVYDKDDKSPVDKVVAHGTAKAITVATSRGGSRDVFYTTVKTMQATAYSYTGHNTATGTSPGRGTIAVDPSVIPMGTRVYIEGYGFATAEDTGGAIKGNIIDLFMTSNVECLFWGRRSVRVYFLR